MAKTTVLQEVKKRMKEMLDTKAAELETVRRKQQEALAQREAADLAISAATASMDLGAYEEAKAAKRKAQTAWDMFTAKYKQLAQQEYITEQDSDKVVDSLLEYEEQLAEDFKAEVAVHLNALADLLKNYQAEVKDVEDTLDGWQRDIHANFRTRGLSSFVDSFTGERTDRSTQPVPVHRTAYVGCSEACHLYDFLKAARKG